MIQIPETAIYLYMWLKNWLFDNSSPNGNSSNVINSSDTQGGNPLKQPIRTIRNSHVSNNEDTPSHDDISTILQEEFSSMNERIGNIESKLSAVVLEINKIANTK